MKGDIMEKETKDVEKPLEKKAEPPDSGSSGISPKVFKGRQYARNGYLRKTGLESDTKAVILTQPQEPQTPAEIFTDNLQRLAPFPVKVGNLDDLKARNKGTDQQGWPK
jgi:hypothetical protein